MRRNAQAQGPVYTNHIRKGGKSGWRVVFTVRQSEQFDALYRQQMAGSGLEMDFGEGLKMRTPYSWRVLKGEKKKSEIDRGIMLAALSWG